MTAKASWIAGSLFASLIPGDRPHEFSENDGTVKAAQRMAGHADSRATKLYDRCGQKVLLEGNGEDPVLNVQNLFFLGAWRPHWSIFSSETRFFLANVALLRLAQANYDQRIHRPT
jgi:hypothetical protein